MLTHVTTSSRILTEMRRILRRSIRRFAFFDRARGALPMHQRHRQLLQSSVDGMREREHHELPIPARARNTEHQQHHHEILASANHLLHQQHRFLRWLSTIAVHGKREFLLQRHTLRGAHPNRPHSSHRNVLRTPGQRHCRQGLLLELSPPPGWIRPRVREYARWAFVSGECVGARDGCAVWDRLRGSVSEYHRPDVEQRRARVHGVRVSS